MASHVDANASDTPSQAAVAETNEATSMNNSPRISIEAKVILTFGTGHALTAAVEGVEIVSCKLHHNEKDSPFAVVLQAEVALCVAPAKVSNAKGDADLTADEVVDAEMSGVKINLEVTAVYWEPVDVAYTEDVRKASIGDILDSFHPGQRPFRRDIIANPGGAFTRLKPSLAVQVTVTQALSTHVRSIPGPHPGHTLLAVMIRHSNTHAHDLSITSLALHPRKTRILPYLVDSETLTVATTSDMSRYVNWGFLDPSTDPHLPLNLKPKEVYSTVLTVDAVTPGDDAADAGRQYCCSFSVTAVLGVTDTATNDTHRRNSQQIIATTDAVWSTRRSVVEPVDSFRVNFTLQQNGRSTHSAVPSTDNVSTGSLVAIVGAPLILHVEITNLSDNSSRLQLLVENSDDVGKWKVFSERDGYKFGLADTEVGTIDQELVAMDSVLALGDLHGRASTTTQVRLIPLKEGTLCIPTFHLVDSQKGKRYACVHRLQAVIAVS